MDVAHSVLVTLFLTIVRHSSLRLLRFRQYELGEKRGKRHYIAFRSKRWTGVVVRVQTMDTES